MESSAAASQVFPFIHEKECPICYTTYGKQPDGIFLCRIVQTKRNKMSNVSRQFEL